MRESSVENSDNSGQTEDDRIERATSPGSRAIRRGNAERQRLSVVDLPVESFVEHDIDDVARELGPVGTYTRGIPPQDVDDRADNADVLPAGEFKTLTAALNEEQYGTLRDLTDVEYEGSEGERPLVNPSAASSYATSGVDPNDVPIGRDGSAGVDGTTDAAPRFDGARTAAEMIELYWQALVRDVPFQDFKDHDVISSAIKELTGTDGYDADDGPLPGTSRTAFRGVLPGAQQGPYVSQFLYLLIPRGAQVQQQTLRPFIATDFLTDVERWRDVQNGQTLSTEAAPDLSGDEDRLTTQSSPFLDSIAQSLGRRRDESEPPEAFPTELLGEDRRYITTGRDLATYVRANPSQQPYLAAALSLQNYDAPLDSGIPTGEDGPLVGNVPGAFVDFGRTEYQTAVVDVIQAGLRAAWYRKWLVHRRLRPEEYGGRVNAAHPETANPDGPPDRLSDEYDGESYETIEDVVLDAVLDSEAVSRIIEETDTDTALLPQAYPNGSPTHPSYPAGHATTAAPARRCSRRFSTPTSGSVSKRNSDRISRQRSSPATTRQANSTAFCD